MNCDACGQSNRPGARFCDACGGPLPQHPGTGADLRAAGERRLITALFVDLVESTPLSERLDAEDLRAVIQQLQHAATRAVERFGGHVAQYLGDGVLVYFGYPRAHEDDASRALRAALAIGAALPALNRRLRPLVEEGIRVRMGAHTGEVVVGPMGAGPHLETLAMGETVNVAARVVGVAEPDALVISDETRRLVEAEFELEALGSKALRGVAEPVPVYRVVGLREASSAGTTPTPMVGRDVEMGRLMELFARLGDGAGAVALVEGEAGIGKSRLAGAVAGEVVARGGVALEWQCSRYHGATPFHPVVAALRAEIAPADTGVEAEQVARRLEAAFDPTGLSLPEAVELVGSLLELPLPKRYEPAAASPELRRRRTIEALAAWVACRAHAAPVALVVEDLHWADPSTLDLLGALVLASRNDPLLLVLTYRPGFAPPFEPGDVEHLLLRPLERWHVTTLVDALAAGRSLPAALREQVVEQTDGVPLFVEELTKAVMEASEARGAQSAAAAIPSTLRGSLMARLDNLGEAKRLAQVASVLGRSFRRDLLEAVVDRDRRSLERDLGQLVSSTLVQPGPADDYAFRHALIQETAYRSLLREERRSAHARVVDALEARFPERVQAEPELSAHHCEQAERYAEAVRHLVRAGEQALQRSAHREALGHFERGLSLLERLPENHDRARLEVGLLVPMGAPISALRGWGHADIEKSQLRALELSRQLGEGPELYQALGALYLYYGPRAEIERAEEVAAQLVELGARAREPLVEQMGLGFQGLLSFYRGRLEPALALSKRMLSLEGEIPAWYVHDIEPPVLGRATASMTLALQGAQDEAVALAEQAISHGRRSKNPLNLASALQFAGLTYFTIGAAEGATACGEEGLEVCTRQGYPALIGLARALGAWGRVQRSGDAGEIAAIQQGIEEGSRVRALIEGPRVLGLLADAQRRVGEVDAALAAATAGLRLAERSGNHFWDAELMRLSAETELSRRDGAARERGREGLLVAGRIARAQGAALLESRIARALARQSTA